MWGLPVLVSASPGVMTGTQQTATGGTAGMDKRQG